jgi:hypothetical protein
VDLVVGGADELRPSAGDEERAGVEEAGATLRKVRAAQGYKLLPLTAIRPKNDNCS